MEAQMNDKINFAIFLFITISITFGHVKINYPKGSEVFNSGDVVTIEWGIVIDHGSNDWDLLFSSDGGQTWSVIVNDLSKSVLKYEWTVPDIPTNTGKIQVVQDNSGSADYTASSGNFIINHVTGVEPEDVVPGSFILYPAFPNPFNSTTNISFTLPAKDFVTLTVYNIAGEKIKDILNSEMSSGFHQIRWQADDVSSGIYLYTIKTRANLQVAKVVLIK